MVTATHKQHIATRVSHNNCDECRADTERRFVSTNVWKYGHVREYLGHITPRLEAIKAGNATVDARIWYRKFRKALQVRITGKVTPQMGRKYSDSYLERLGQFAGSTDATYLRNFAARGASCL